MVNMENGLVSLPVAKMQSFERRGRGNVSIGLGSKNKEGDPEVAAGWRTEKGPWAFGARAGVLLDTKRSA